jgi:hypothetical protein
MSLVLLDCHRVYLFATNTSSLIETHRLSTNDWFSVPTNKVIKEEWHEEQILYD